MENKKRFLSIYREHIHRKNSEKILDYLLSEHNDFSRAPASTRFHGAYARGLLEHGLNMRDYLKDYLSRLRVKECYHIDYNEEAIIIAALLHDIYKVNCYKESTRNQKVNGQWVRIPFYEYRDRLSYGHGKGSVYIITGFMRLNREKAFAIRYHMGFSGSEEVRDVGTTFEIYPSAFTLSTTGMGVTYYLEGKQQAVIERGRKQAERSCNSCRRIKYHNR